MIMGYRTCARCDRSIDIGDEFYTSNLTGDRLFCSSGCMERFIADDSDLVEKVVEEWVEDHADGGELASSDPYDRYGVSESDFH